ncbi:MAG: hypothetical protein IT357_06225 [Gemmatimonadaceae bacterium]|nr:hypothetical protein [Gemmatimonadaceae bacterium]
MIRLARLVFGIAVGVLELLMVYAFICMLPTWLPAQEARYHPASDAAAIALVQRHERSTGAARPPAQQHFIIEMKVGTNAPIRTETWIAEPHRILSRTEVGGRLVMEFGFDGTTGWSNSPMTGPVRLPTSQLEILRASAGGMAAPSIDSTRPLRATGQRTFDGQLVEGVRVITATGDTAESFYSVSTGLLAGMRMRAQGAIVLGGAPGDSIVLLLRDYKQIGGRTGSMTMIYRGMGMESEARTVHLDYEPIDPVRFKPPAGLPR